MTLPRLYPIIDRATLERRGVRLRSFVGELARAGVRIVQYRDKFGEPQDILQAAEQIALQFADRGGLLILNDRPDLALLAGWTGVHVGHTDMSPCAARKVLPPSETVVIGVSTHTDEQVRAADRGCADYVAIGPVFATSSKADAEPEVGLAGVRRARALTSKPLVAIGGITLENARSVIDAGADSVAVISALLIQGERPGKLAEDFLTLLR